MSTDKEKWKEKYKEYIKSPEWYNLKIDLLQKRGCKCQKCGKKKRPTGLHIHHLTYERLYNELPQDLMILCPVCHMKEHGLIKEKKKPAIKKHKNKKISVQKVLKRSANGRYKNLKAFDAAYKRALKR